MAAQIISDVVQHITQGAPGPIPTKATAQHCKEYGRKQAADVQLNMSDMHLQGVAAQVSIAAETAAPAREVLVAASDHSGMPGGPLLYGDAIAQLASAFAPRLCTLAPLARRRAGACSARDGTSEYLCYSRTATAASATENEITLGRCFSGTRPASIIDVLANQGAIAAVDIVRHHE